MAKPFSHADLIEVLLWGDRVGAVTLDPATGFYAFEYDPKFRRSGLQVAPVGMPLSQGGFPFVFTDLPTETYQRLPAMLADALPDRFGNQLINAWMARRGFQASEVTALDRLAYMGKRGMGALTFRPALISTSRSSATALNMSALVEQARGAVEGDLGTPNQAHAALAQIISVGTSAGGVRAKAVVAWNPANNQIRAGQFDVEPGFEHWLLKIDGLRDDMQLGTSGGYGRIEFAYSLMAKEAGVDMHPCHLLEENGRAHFMTKRFDREANRRLHMQSLCAIAHLDYKQRSTHDYSQWFMAVDQLGLGHDTKVQVLTRMLFNLLGVNMDDHTKNVSFLMDEAGQWQLAPAYDVSYAYNPKGEWTHQHLMSINGKFRDVRLTDVMTAAQAAGVKLAVKPALDGVRAAVA